MSDILSIGLSGLTSSRLRAMTAANNLANINTPGYKAQSADTSSLAYGNGAAVDRISTLDAMGSLIPTDNPLDLAIAGNGYFQVTDGQGNNYYTRDGSFSRNANGQMVNSQGFSLSPGVDIPQNAESVSVGTDGTVTAQAGGQNVALGAIQLAQFSNPSGLSRGGGNLLSQTGSSGIAQMGAPGTGGLGTIQSGFVEGSNVDIAREAVALRMEENAFKASAALIRAGDEMQRDAIDLIG
jgi:flagellar basal-body rod protein FlgG